MAPEQTLVDSALRSWRSNMDRAAKFFGSLSKEEVELEVAPMRNPLIYVWGHVTAFNDAMIPLLGFGHRLYPESDEAFVSQPDRTISHTLVDRS